MVQEAKIYEGHGDTIQQALERAHEQILPRPGRDFAISKVTEWGMQRGGFIDRKLFWVKVIELENVPFKK